MKVAYKDLPEEKKEGLRAGTRKWVKANREKHRRAVNNWDKRNPRRHKHAVKEIGITVDEIERLKEKQDNRCAICGTPADDGSPKGTLNVDHDHGTKVVRGLLCFRCNYGLGYFQDDPQRLIAAARYLQHSTEKETDMSIKRSIILRGNPDINEYGSAASTVKPGYLVKGVTTLDHQTVTGKVVRALALERDELGQGIDNTKQGSGTSSAFYASGDRVKVGVFDSGDEATVFVASGAGTVNEDALLGSAGDGTFSVQAAAGAIARSMENLGVVTVGQSVRVQFI